ncbi:MAG: hypothetical protein EOM12_14565 [Verrucomicrobiae bacterium]|nr:hypothetical protein [Verrucomicrobiae bacterium]
MTMQKEYICSFHVDSVGEAVQKNIFLPTNSTIYMVFVADGVGIEDSDSLLELIAPLVINISIYEGNGSNEMYKFRIDGEELGYPGNWHAPYASFVTLFPEFILGADWMLGVSCTCSNENETCPVHDGRLKIENPYLMDIDICSSAPLTNQLQLWFYYPIKLENKKHL